MTWQERRQRLEDAVDAYMERLPATSGEGVRRPRLEVNPSVDKDTIMSIAYLVDAARDARFEAEREDDQKSFHEIRGELDEIVRHLPDTIIVPEGVVIAPQVVEVMQAGQMLKLLVERLQRLDL